MSDRTVPIIAGFSVVVSMALILISTVEYITGKSALDYLLPKKSGKDTHHGKNTK